jgi:hypothetical protein
MAFEEDIRQSDHLFLGSDPQLDECKVPQIRDAISSAFPLVLSVRHPWLRLTSPVITVVSSFAVLTRQSQDVQCITLILHIGDDDATRISGRDRWMQV